MPDARDTVLTYNAGTVVHEVTDPDGFRYTLFTAVLSVAEAHDLTMEGALQPGLTFRLELLEQNPGR